MYTCLRVGMFLVLRNRGPGIWGFVSGRDEVPAIWAVVIALVIWGRVVQIPQFTAGSAGHQRAVPAARASAKFEEMKAREDTD